ncbi:MAG TPA: hypothetical protein VFZ89_17560, partial [Solirubrobacteraceae bacterium]
MTPRQQEQQDLRAALRALWRWKFLVLALLIVVPGICYALEARKTEEYRSGALVQGQAAAIDPTLVPNASGTQNILTVARLVKTRTIARAAGEHMRPPQPGEPLLGRVNVTADVDTGFLTISGTDTDPRRAADIANAFALAISDNRNARTVGQINYAIGGVKRQLDSVSAKDVTTRAQLRTQLARLRGLRATQRPDSAIVERAAPSATPVGRNTRRALELGIVIAVLLSIGAIAVAENIDRRIRHPEELEELTGLPLLSTIPATAFGSVGNDEEAFQMLRASLTYFNVERRISSVVIASPGQEDGKTTVATRLAVSLYRAGKHVILVDADLRHASIGPRFGLSASDGLGAVVVGERQLYEVLATPQVDEPGSAAE